MSLPQDVVFHISFWLYGQDLTHFLSAMKLTKERYRYAYIYDYIWCHDEIRHLKRDSKYQLSVGKQCEVKKIIQRSRFASLLKNELFGFKRPLWLKHI